MPEITLAHFMLFAILLVAGVITGWILRGNRALQEKSAVNVGWQEQVEAQRSEHDRLTEQNKTLMEQISQYQASNKDAKNRARELSEAVQEAYKHRDSLQREIKDIRSNLEVEIKDIRGNLEVALTQRDELQSSIAVKTQESEDAAAQDTHITKLTKQLESWQDRLPPLIERFQQRNQEAEQLEADLVIAQQRIAELEASVNSVQTRIEPVQDPGSLTDGRDASNDSLDNIEQLSEVEDTQPSPPEELPEELPEEPPEEPPNSLRDALQRIRGIGPAIEKTLNEMGIFRFQQIADMSEYDIDRIAQRLKGFHSRIYRENWTGQARELRDQRSDG